MKDKKIFTKVDLNNPVHRAAFSHRGGFPIKTETIKRQGLPYRLLMIDGYCFDNDEGREWCKDNGFTEVPFLEYITTYEGAYLRPKQPFDFVGGEEVEHSDNGNVRIGSQTIMFNSLERLYLHAKMLRESK